MSDVDVFSALANPVRRRLLELLVEEPRNAGALAAEFDLSRPAVSEHLQVLRRAHLVTEEPRGRERFYRLAPEPFAEMGEWLRPFEAYWRNQLGALANFLEDQPKS
ncbi:MAG TPA: metalloregulator ArsR/SmtB family transcription factor [Microthrixaceae bacterium]|nr:metalloregulator ArsR/SmtB family transcription factor [Microthrixaceae bacterium]